MKTRAQKMNPRTGILVLALLLLTISSFGQTTYKQTGTPTIIIAGTSTMHDWTMTSKESTYNAVFETNADGTHSLLKTVSVTIPAESLKSGKGAMDKNAYKALKTEQHKQISFQLTSSKIAGNKITCSGNLTISGNTKPVDVDVTYDVKNGNMVCKGSRKIKMTDFKVEPPSFMFGSVTTGDEITVTFEVTLTPAKI
jgi:polyisoprenoid-binding protein YceI